MKPSDIKDIAPMCSVFYKSEYETVAQNIAIILSKKDNEFKIITWDTYKKERKKDRDFSEIEKVYFDKVINYFESEKTIRSFSYFWNI